MKVHISLNPWKAVHGKENFISALSNFGDGRPKFGIESLVTDYAELSEDLKGKGLL